MARQPYFASSKLTVPPRLPPLLRAAKRAEHSEYASNPTEKLLRPRRDSTQSGGTTTYKRKIERVLLAGATGIGSKSAFIPTVAPSFYNSKALRRKQGAAKEAHPSSITVQKQFEQRPVAPILSRKGLPGLFPTSSLHSLFTQRQQQRDSYDNEISVNIGNRRVAPLFPPRCGSTQPRVVSTSQLERANRPNESASPESGRGAYLNFDSITGLGLHPASQDASYRHLFSKISELVAEKRQMEKNRLAFSHRAKPSGDLNSKDVAGALKVLKLKPEAGLTPKQKAARRAIKRLNADLFMSNQSSQHTSPLTPSPEPPRKTTTSPKPPNSNQLSYESATPKSFLEVKGQQRTPEHRRTNPRHDVSTESVMNAGVTANFSEIGEDEKVFILPDLDQGDLSFLNSVNSLNRTGTHEVPTEDPHWQPLGVKKISIGPILKIEEKKPSLMHSRRSSMSKVTNRVQKSQDGKFAKYISIPKLSEQLTKPILRKPNNEVSKQIATTQRGETRFEEYCSRLYNR